MTSSAVPVDPAETATKHVGILLFDDVEELDAVGPWEILANWTLTYPKDGWTVSVWRSEDGQPVRAAKGLVLGAHHSFADVPPLEALIHPGGQGTRTLMRRDPPCLGPPGRHRAADDQCVHRSVASYCRGWAALTGRPATTHWESSSCSVDRSIDVRPTARFVDDGDLITSAGVSAGIDMALHLVAWLVSADRARAVRRDVQHDPQPPV